jgi:hypothetical protein
MTLIAFEEAIRAVIEHYSHRTVPGWTSLMVVLCLCNAALMISVGILGEYVGRIYEEGKGRPLYLVSDVWNLMQRENREGNCRLLPDGSVGDEVSLRSVTVVGDSANVD